MAARQFPHSGPSGRIRPGLPPHRRQVASPTRRPDQWAPFLKIAPAIILLIGILLPVEVRVNVADQTIYGYRMAWLLVSPWLIFVMARGNYRPHFIDALVVLAALWMVLSFSVVEGLSKGAPAGIALGLDVLMPYLIMRAAIRDLTDFRCFLIILAPIALILAASMALESITHVRFIRELFEAAFGAVGITEFGRVILVGEIDARMGLMRAMGPFSHPILAGVFFAGLMPLFHFSRLRGWPFIAGMASGAGAIFSLSSAAIFGLVIFVVLAGYDLLRRAVSFLNWPIFLVTAFFAGLAVHLASGTGIIEVVIRYTINSQTGYYRLLIWEYGLRSVKKYPFFGIGYQPYERLSWMSESVDTIWLALAIRNGLPVAILIGLSVVLAIVGLAISASRTRSPDAATYIGLAITLFMFFVLGFTVSFFGGMLLWFVATLGIGVSFASFGQSQSPRAAVHQFSQRQLPVRRTRLGHRGSQISE